MQNTVDLSLVVLNQVNRYFGLNNNEINGDINKKSKEGTDEENSSIDVEVIFF